MPKVNFVTFCFISYSLFAVEVDQREHGRKWLRGYEEFEVK